ncbi:GspH/FimT family pseudopilin [Zhongshania guokunii]|uniref:Type II secretion system protein H n=1 Tax=Zhongshania guokunii TaxID=641783 RepID=A0ABV3U933_9GAMM
MLGHKKSVFGYTLIELMVTVAVVAVLATVAIPNFSSFISKSRERADVQSMLKALVAARSEAVVRARPVTLTANAGDWAKGWRSWVDINDNGSYDAGEAFKETSAIKTSAVITAKIGTTAVTSVTFDNQGFIKDSKAVVLSYRSSPEKCSHDRDINITASGQVTISDRVCP